MIKCLEFGLLTSCARLCVHTLRVCCLEMESIMMKMLPRILETLSRIRANKDMALPLLMFLSCELSNQFYGSYDIMFYVCMRLRVWRYGNQFFHLCSQSECTVMTSLWFRTLLSYRVLGSKIPYKNSDLLADYWTSFSWIIVTISSKAGPLSLGVD